MARGGGLKKALRMGFLAGVGFAVLRAARARRAGQVAEAPPTWPPLPTALVEEPPAATAPLDQGLDSTLAPGGSAALVAEAAVLEAAGITEAAEVDEDAVLAHRAGAEEAGPVQVEAPAVEVPDEVLAAWAPPPPGTLVEPVWAPPDLGSQGVGPAVPTEDWAPPSGGSQVAEDQWPAPAGEPAEPGQASWAAEMLAGIGPVERRDPVERREPVDNDAVRHPVAEGPVTDAPVADAPVADAPVADAPVWDAPVADAPVWDAPVADAPVADAPVWDTPVADAPVAEDAGAIADLDAAILAEEAALEAERLEAEKLELARLERARAEAGEATSTQAQLEREREAALQRFAAQREEAAALLALQEEREAKAKEERAADGRRPLMATDFGSPRAARSAAEKGSVADAATRPQPSQDIAHDAPSEPAVAAEPAAVGERQPEALEPPPDVSAEDDLDDDELEAPGLEPLVPDEAVADLYEEPTWGAAVDRPSTGKRSSPRKKAAPAKRATPAKKAAPAKRAAPTKRATPARKAAPAKRATPAKKAAPVKKLPAVKRAGDTARTVAPNGPFGPRPIPAAGAPASKPAPVKKSSRKQAAQVASPPPARKKVSTRTKKANVAWVDPVGGSCPTAFPVKGTMASGIFHVVGGLFYDRSKADRCYRDAAAARADGLRQAKR